VAKVTIVFIPEEDDIVWRISSEKIPHMTFLFLGDISDPSVIDNIVQYVEHTNEMSLHRFGMGVDRRGVLGDDEADVLFFEEEWSKGWLDDVRSHLLQNPNVKSAFDSTKQFDTWVPHLTLGFPGSPAKEDTRDFPGIRWVQFDKIAVWTSDFDGPGEFILKRNNDMAMSEKVLEFLSHHGVKGMKWGVRKRSGGQSGGTARTKFKKPPNKLSNEELQKRIKRMETERKYNSLNAGDKSKGRAFVEEVLSSSGRKVAKGVVTAAGFVAVKTLLESHISSELASAVSKRL
jgi:2'-5' RNA ligase